jgi:hypothetical protein
MVLLLDTPGKGTVGYQISYELSLSYDKMVDVDVGLR